MKILAIRPKKSSVNNYRMDLPLGNLGASFITTLLQKNSTKTIGELAKKLKSKGDAWVIKYIDHYHTLDVLHSCKKAVDAKIIVDLDDNIWQIPFGNAAIGNPADHANRIFMMTQSVSSADYVTVSTEPLADAVRPLNENVVVLPNLINPEDWKFKRNKHKAVRIGWVYSPTHIPDIKEVEDALSEIKKKYGDEIEIVIFGTDKNIFSFEATPIKAVRYDKYPKIFMEAGIDISIAPLADNDFNKSKSNIKWLESTMAGASFIGSKVFPYENTVKHGKTGYIAGNKSQWIKYLSLLIEDKEKRKELVKSAKEEVLEKYNLKKDTMWKQFYDSL